MGWFVNFVLSFIWFAKELNLLISEGIKMEVGTIMWFCLSTYLGVVKYLEEVRERRQIDDKLAMYKCLIDKNARDDVEEDE